MPAFSSRGSLAGLWLVLALSGPDPRRTRFAWWTTSRSSEIWGYDRPGRTASKRLSRGLPQLRQSKEELERQEAELSRLIEINADETLVTRQIDKVEAIRGQPEQDAAHCCCSSMRQVLTPEQRVKLKAVHEQWEREHRQAAERGTPETVAASDLGSSDWMMKRMKKRMTVTSIELTLACAAVAWGWPSPPPRRRAAARRVTHIPRAGSAGRRSTARGRPGADGRPAERPVDGDTRPVVAHDAGRRRQAGARSQPRHRRAAAEPADQRHLAYASSESIYNPTLTSTISTAVDDQPVDQHDLGRHHRRPASPTAPSTLQRRASRRACPGAAAASGQSEQQPGTTTTSRTPLYNPTYNTELVGQYTQPLLRGFKTDSTRQQLAGDQDQPRHLRRPAARHDHQHAVERPQRVLGLRVRGAGGRSRAASRSTWRTSWSQDNQTRVQVGTMAPIDVVQAQVRAGRRAVQKLVTAQATQRTTELALKRLIVSGTQDPNWNVDDRPGRPARLPPGADRRRGGDPARAQRAHGPDDRARRTSRPTTSR